MKMPISTEEATVMTSAPIVRRDTHMRTAHASAGARVPIMSNILLASGFEKFKMQEKSTKHLHAHVKKYDARSGPRVSRASTTATRTCKLSPKSNTN